MNRKQFKKPFQEARDFKAKQIKICRKYLSVAKSLGLSVKSTSIKYWTEQLWLWRDTSLEIIDAQLYKAKK